MSEVSERLRKALAKHDSLIVAVSGGVDSLTLASFAHSMTPVRVAHAVSPAVPPEATARVRDMAQAQGWDLHVLDAREFDDPAYLHNPLNRCYFCKTNLYARIRETLPEGAIAAGTNTDDLGEYRPGLIAASEHGVVHPYVEAGVSKTALRELARGLGLGDVASLPAQPCLASRIETGIAIDATDLAFVHRIETLLRAETGADNVRCRMTASGVKVEIDGDLPEGLRQRVAAICREEGRDFQGVARYRRGSAFVGAPQ
ncbi:adenine nucleotide alpha hydrolase [Oceaniglobus trochenteri]|uniref:adenine nucleotide alpha hydrolase n=1 Tax=Oceaniglobus trochenteri TaxID=2763260 RepID=UPI001CFF6101|nr:adenine nucleotide alpha hydrolase [Oceaniglobus trochenteri]